VVAAPTLSTRVDEFLYERIAAGVTAVSGRVQGDGPAPGTMTLPYARFQLLSSLLVGGLNATRILGRLVYLVEIVAEAESWTPLQSGSDQIYTTLHQHAPDTTSVAGLVVLSCVCEEEIRRYLGWRVRLEAEST
jgi:hypothetical protein